ncbi:hypothetical protein BH10ACT9_BH10ACT9_08390 [soil metagenome]
MKLSHTCLTAGAAAGIAFASIGGSVVAQADPLPFGPDTCVQGFVWREARPGDTVCVTPAVRDAVAFQNANPGSNRDPNAGSGPLSCSQGYVWREAFDGDTICVTPANRSATLADNAAAQARRQATQPLPTSVAQAGSAVVFEITGSGTVYTIDTDPPSSRVAEGTAVPFSRTMRIGPDVDLLQVIAVSKTGEQGCRIILDGVVVVNQGLGDAHCVYDRG